MNAVMARFSSKWLFAGAVALVGCGAPRLRMSDVVATHDGKASVSAYAERTVAGFFRGGERNVKVRFVADGKVMGRAKTDSTGKAATRFKLPDPPPQHIEGVASVGGQEANESANVFVWSKDRPIVLVDVDATISETDYLELVLAEVDGASRPIKDAAETLKELSKDYYVAYITARPHSLINKTRRWLAEHDFPPGPVLMSLDAGDVILQEAFKQKAVADFRKHWPNALLGIGDNGNDIGGFSRNDMLTVIVNSGPSVSRHPALVKVRDWQQVGDFFRANRETLLSIKQLKNTIKGKGPDLALRAQPPEPETRVRHVAGDEAHVAAH